MEGIKVTRVTPQQNQVLLVEFNTGVRKEYDVRQLFERFPEYRILEHRPLFDTVHVDCGGCSVTWTPDIDISEWELRDNGVNI